LLAVDFFAWQRPDDNPNGLMRFNYFRLLALVINFHRCPLNKGILPSIATIAQKEMDNLREGALFLNIEFMRRAERGDDFRG
jgi:hypothetical protein